MNILETPISDLLHIKKQETKSSTEGFIFRLRRIKMVALQGSILGSLLFVIYTNDLLETVTPFCDLILLE